MAINNLKSPFFLDRKNEPREIISLTDVKTSQPITIGVVEHPVGTSLDSLLANADSRPYKVYSALLSQTSTDAPVAVVFENTLGFTPVWTLNATGQFRATYTDGFTLAKTQVFATMGGANDKNVIVAAHTDNDYIQLLQYTASTGAAVNVATNIALEIRVYL